MLVVIIISICFSFNEKFKIKLKIPEKNKICSFGTFLLLGNLKQLQAKYYIHNSSKCCVLCVVLYFNLHELSNLWAI